MEASIERAHAQNPEVFWKAEEEEGGGLTSSPAKGDVGIIGVGGPLVLCCGAGDSGALSLYGLLSQLHLQ